MWYPCRESRGKIICAAWTRQRDELWNDFHSRGLLLNSLISICGIGELLWLIVYNGCGYAVLISDCRDLYTAIWDWSRLFESGKAFEALDNEFRTFKILIFMLNLLQLSAWLLQYIFKIWNLSKLSSLEFFRHLNHASLITFFLSCMSARQRGGVSRTLIYNNARLISRK